MHPLLFSLDISQDAISRPASGSKNRSSAKGARLESEENALGPFLRLRAFSELSCVDEKDAGMGWGPAKRGGAFAPYKRFAAGKTLAEAEFTAQPLAALLPCGCGVLLVGASAEHSNAEGWSRPPGGGTQKRRHDLRSCLLFGKGRLKSIFLRPDKTAAKRRPQTKPEPSDSGSGLEAKKFPVRHRASPQGGDSCQTGNF